MKSIATASGFASVLLMLACGVVSASDAPPKILHEPVLGLRYHTDKVKFEVLPPNVFEICPDLITGRVARRAWIYASATVSART
jgi:hypothetical protein